MDPPAPGPADAGPTGVWQRDVAAASSLVEAFMATRVFKAELDAFELTTLAAAAALVAEQLARADHRSVDAELPERIMVAELAAASRSSERTVRRLLDDAADLCARFANTVVALREGRISRAHVGVIHDAGYDIDDAEARAVFEAAAIGRAETMTPGRLRPVVQILAARANPRSIDERHATARQHRGVRVVDLSDGMAELVATIPATLAYGIHDRLTQHAHAIIDTRRTEPAAAFDVEPTRDTRSVDELRADVLCDLLLTGTPEGCTAGDGLSAIRGIVQVTVPVLTATGHSTEPAVLAGHGPIDMDTARHLAGGAKGWERVMTCPTTGSVLAVDRYRPSKHLARHLRARDERCRFPGCRVPVWRCDIDHTRPAAHGGPTDISNLAHLCRGHHTLKHTTPWAVRQQAGGVLEWTSPTGRTYTDHPEPTLRFTPEPEPPHLRTPSSTAQPDNPLRYTTPDTDPPAF